MDENTRVWAASMLTCRGVERSGRASAAKRKPAAVVAVVFCSFAARLTVPAFCVDVTEEEKKAEREEANKEAGKKKGGAKQKGGK